MTQLITGIWRSQLVRLYTIYNDSTSHLEGTYTFQQTNKKEGMITVKNVKIVFLYQNETKKTSKHIDNDKKLCGK